jgi:hypothetical protein
LKPGASGRYGSTGFNLYSPTRWFSSDRSCADCADALV